MLRAARCGEIPSRGGARFGPDRKGLARSVHPDDRPLASKTSRSRTPRSCPQAAIAKLDKYHLLILDDLAYVTKDQAETSVLFRTDQHFARYERRSMLITASQPFGRWGKIFSDQAMTLAAIDRIVHHATILEIVVDSYRRKEAVDNARGAGRPPTRAIRDHS